MTYFHDAVSSTGSRTTFTISAWVKVDGKTANQTIFGTGTTGSNTGKFYFAISSGQVRIGGGGNVYRVSTRLFRDPASWYHLVCAVDTTQGSDGNRVKFYVNGESYTDWGAGYNSITQNQNTPVNESGKQNTFGAEQGGGEQWKGYIGAMVLVDGAQLTPSNFGETDSTTGEWKPKPDPTGVTYGTNGVYLKCENSGNLGLDSSGNSNNYTANNVNTNAQVLDNPSNSFATLNPGIWNTTTNFTNVLYNANTRFPTSVIGNSTKGWPAGTLAVNKGKWYAEYFCEYISSQNASGGPGIYDYDYNGNSLTAPTATAGGILYDPYGRIRTDGSDAGSFGTWTTNDIIGIYMDLDNNELRYSKNGSILNSGNSMATITNPAGTTGGDYWTFCPYDESSNAFDASMNFGSPNSYFGSCTNTDNAGLGKFKYSPTLSGTHYYSLCTKNINSYG